MQWELIYTKGVGTIIVIAFFGLVVVFLRFLYGPKGIFRDPQWDAWNREEKSRRKREKWMEEDASFRERFLKYALNFVTGDPAKDPALELKIEHSLRVLANAEEIAASESVFSKEESARALRLAALFHDVGRFEQFRRYQTFADAVSCNHAALGAKIIRYEGFLREETPRVQRLVLTAVAAHNRMRVPAPVSGQARDVLVALRDADKLDILRVMEEHLAPGARGDSVVLLHLQDKEDAWSPEVVRSLEKGEVARYGDMRFINDFRILLCTWLHDLHFGTSLNIARKEGRYARILAGLGAIPEVEAKARALVENRLGVVPGAG